MCEQSRGASTCFPAGSYQSRVPVGPGGNGSPLPVESRTVQSLCVVYAHSPRMLSLSQITACVQRQAPTPTLKSLVRLARARSSLLLYFPFSSSFFSATRYGKLPERKGKKPKRLTARFLLAKQASQAAFCTERAHSNTGAPSILHIWMRRCLHMASFYCGASWLPSALAGTLPFLYIKKTRVP